MRKHSIRGKSGGGGAVSTSPESDTSRRSKTEVSSPRVVVPDIVPTSWVDRLLVAVIDLPLARGERAVVEAVVDAVAGILPSYAVGACIASEAGGPGQLIVKRMPAGGVERRGGRDPTRIFPGLANEYAAALPGLPGSSLHAASDEHELEPDSSPAVHLIDRAAMALGRALPGARASAHASDPSLDEHLIQTDKLARFGQIAAGVVHELNNPLTSIVAYSEYLIRKAGGPLDGDDVERLHRIHASAKRMLRFTRDLVSYARPSSGTVGMVIVHDVVDQAIVFCEHILVASKVVIERRYGADVRTIRGMNEQLVQVFVNLLTNACQAAPERGGYILVSTRHHPADGILVVIEDNGSGISPDHVPHVFTPFFTTKARKEGTGLGLSIVKNIIDGHGGSIRVESELGRGTRFTIELPYAG